MNVIPKQQLYNRWDFLPDILREAMVSETNSQFIWKTGEAEHLSKEKVATVSRLTGYTLMGFIHPEELAGEIKNELGIDGRIAAAIAEPLNRKIFQPLRDELEKVYAPPSLPAQAGVSTAPTAGEELKASRPAMLDSILPTGPTQQVPAPPAPPVTSRVEGSNVEGPAPLGTSLGKFAPAGKSMSIPRPVAPTETPENSTPSPFILHKESEFKPISPSGREFRVGLSEEQFGRMEEKWKPAPKPAQIETHSTSSGQAHSMGSVSSPRASSGRAHSTGSFGATSLDTTRDRQDKSGQASSVPQIKPVSPEPRVVHYSDLKTPLPEKAPMPPAPSTGSTDSRPEGEARSVGAAPQASPVPRQAPAPQVEKPLPKPTPAPAQQNLPRPPQVPKPAQSETLAPRQNSGQAGSRPPQGFGGQVGQATKPPLPTPFTPSRVEGRRAEMPPAPTPQPTPQKQEPPKPPSPVNQSGTEKPQNMFEQRPKS